MHIQYYWAFFYSKLQTAYNKIGTQKVLMREQSTIGEEWGPIFPKMALSARKYFCLVLCKFSLNDLLHIILTSKYLIFFCQGTNLSPTDINCTLTLCFLKKP